MPENYEIKITLSPDPAHPDHTLTKVDIPAGLPGHLCATAIQQLQAAMLAQAPNDSALHSAKLGLFQDLSKLPCFKEDYANFFMN